MNEIAHSRSHKHEIISTCDSGSLIESRIIEHRPCLQLLNFNLLLYKYNQPHKENFALHTTNTIIEKTFQKDGQFIIGGNIAVIMKRKLDFKKYYSMILLGSQFKNIIRTRIRKDKVKPFVFKPLVIKTALNSKPFTESPSEYQLSKYRGKHRKQKLIKDKVGKEIVREVKSIGTNKIDKNLQGKKSSKKSKDSNYGILRFKSNQKMVCKKIPLSFHNQHQITQKEQQSQYYFNLPKNLHKKDKMGSPSRVFHHSRGNSASKLLTQRSTKSKGEKLKPKARMLTHQ